MTAPEPPDAAYTLLETLLLFHNVSLHGTHSTSFLLISNELLKNPIISALSPDDPRRLSPDALQEHYRHQLTQATAEIEAEGGTVDGNDQIQLIAQITDRFYKKWRARLVKEIREEEEKVVRLQRECREIETGAWDERLVREAEARRRSESVKLEMQRRTESPVMRANRELNHFERQGVKTGMGMRVH